MIKRKNTILAALILGASLTMTGCSEADKVNYNMSKQADYFECERKITVYNARTDKIIMEAEGYMSISNDSENELVCTVKTGADEYRKPNAFDNAYIQTDGSMAEGTVNKIELVQGNIPHESYLATYITALDLCLQGIMSPSTLGIDVKKLDNADAQREKEKATLYSRNNIVERLQKVLPKLVTATFNAIDTLNKTAINDIDIDVTFGEYANPSFESQVETVSKAKQGGIMSIEASVDELYGDTKDDEWKQEEIARLKAEQGISDMEEPALNMQADGFTV